MHIDDWSADGLKAEYSRMLNIMPEMKTEYNTIK